MSSQLLGRCLHSPAASHLKSLGDSADWWCVGSIATVAEAQRHITDAHLQIATCICKPLPWQKCSKSHVWKDSQLWAVNDNSFVCPLRQKHSGFPAIIINVHIYRLIYAFTDKSTHLQIDIHIVNSFTTVMAPYAITRTFRSVCSFLNCFQG